MAAGVGTADHMRNTSRHAPLANAASPYRDKKDIVKNYELSLWKGH
jgi:hypothetical protein